MENFQKSIKNIKNNLINIPGWHTNRKIIVFESDDWGSIRMPSKEVYNSLLKEGIRVDLCPYNRLDNLASHLDLEILFNTLNSYKDFRGNHPIITANTNVANPDFNKIKINKFKNYYYEPFTKTLKKYYNNDNVFKLWEKGINENIFYPQLHGREHVNPIIWIELLRENHIEIRKAFDLYTFGLSRITSPKIVKLHLASLIFSNDKEMKIIQKSLIEGANIFEDIFKFRSESFIAPVYTWDIKLEKTLKDIGVKYIQGGNAHKSYSAKTNKMFRVKRHFTGDKNKHKQIYINRNCFFEPSLMPDFSIENTLKQIEISFRWGKPAVISSHRVNFIGTIEEKNREKNIKLLNELLKKIITKWPDVEFMTSDSLGKIIKKKDENYT